MVEDAADPTVITSGDEETASLGSDVVVPPALADGPVFPSIAELRSFSDVVVIGEVVSVGESFMNTGGESFEGGIEMFSFEISVEDWILAPEFVVPSRTITIVAFDWVVEPKLGESLALFLREESKAPSVGDRFGTAYSPLNMENGILRVDRDRGIAMSTGDLPVALEADAASAILLQRTDAPEGGEEDAPPTFRLVDLR